MSNAAASMSDQGDLHQSDSYSKLYLPSPLALQKRPPPESLLSLSLDRPTIVSLFKKRTGLTLLDWQLEAVHSLLHGQHVVAVQPCGSGKTCIFVAPIVVLDELARTSGTGGATGRVTVIVCPRDAIEEQVVSVHPNHWSIN